MSVMDSNVAAPPDLVHEMLNLIRADRLASGDRLPSIRDLSARFGVRPHAVRDALLQAQRLGYVKVFPRSRAVVQGTGTAANGHVLSAGAEAASCEGEPHLFHLLEARQLLEFEAVRQAARRRRLQDLLPVREALNAMHALREPNCRPEYVEHDIRFHLAISRVAGNPVLTSMLKPLLATLRPFLCRLPFEHGRRERTQRSHADIYRALVAGDADAAQRQMEDHLQFAYDNLLGEVQSPPA